MDESGELDGIEDIFNGVSNREDKAGRELSQFTSSVHQCGRVGKKLETDHHFVELVGEISGVGSGGEAPLSSGNGCSYPTEHFFGFFQHLSILVTL